jgi:Spy/CpxP family protein refolding chaperone
MKAKIPWILLAASLAFNVFFAGGYVHAKGRMAKSRGFKGRARVIARKLKLDDRQQQAFEGILGEFDQLRKDRAPERDAFMAELIKDEPDEKLLEEFMAGDSAKMRRLANLALMRKFIGLLTPQQREHYVQLIKKRRSSSG